MNAFTLFAFENHRDALLKELQKTGAVHFKNLQTAEDEELADLTKITADEGRSYAEGELLKVNFALSKTAPYCEKVRPKELSFDEFDSFIGAYDYAAVYEAVKELDERAKALKTEKAKLKTDSDALSIWLRLDVSVKELDSLKNASYLIGTIPKQSAEVFAEALSHDYPCSYVEFLDSVKDDVGLLIITAAEGFEGASNLAKTHGFTKVSLTLDKPPADIIKANDARIAAIEKEEAACEDGIKEQASHYANLQIVCDYFKTLAERHRACGNFLKTKNVCVAEGWFAASDAGIFEDAVRSVCASDYYLETEAVERDSEEVPIKLKNGHFVSAFEGVTEMYSMPKYNEIDPTPLLMPFYMLFFAVMLGDAGYGLVLAIGAFVMGMSARQKGMKRFLRFFFYLGLATVVIGTVFGSLFGVTFFTPLVKEVVDGSPVGRFVRCVEPSEMFFYSAPESYEAAGMTKAPGPILDLQNDVMTMLLLSIAVGIFQIIFGLLIKGYMLVRDGKVLDAIFDVFFWLVAVVTLVILVACGLGGDAVPPFLTDNFQTILYVFFGSLIALACTQGRSSPSIGGKIGNGIYSVYNITGYVGDFVSYARLMAIALAGAYIAYSFNLMAGLVAGENFNLIRLPFAALVAVFGGALDLGLGALGGYVHSCRLQYVEYFGKFYEGGGLPFKPFELKNSFINIKK
jgi:V/A-type H+-transporting ATPase subunit I